ncbi:MAG: hypothetical protein M1546_23275 [Chloroflexi bacterium]|nr:hypothetical protein [Chloroflexota bacterium]
MSNTQGFANPSHTISASVQELRQQYVNLWWQLGSDMPGVERTYTPREQADREKQLNQFIDTLTTQLRHMPRQERERAALQQQIVASGAVFAKSALDFDDSHLQAVQTSGLVEAAVDFAQKARRYDAAITSEDIFQAGRNVMTMNLLQLQMGLQVQVTPSIFAYSMLYPYSDNYLDDPDISTETKRAFNERFYRRLQGKAVTPANDYEQKISDLVEMIEGQYERAHYPQIYQSLVDIHLAQAGSLSLHRRTASPYDVDVLGISFEKGGTAVLADVYLVAGTPATRQLEIAFGYGAFTQLMDDLEDVKQDAGDGILTVFSQTAHRWPLDTLTNRLFHFGNWVLDHMADLSPAGTVPGPLFSLMKRCVHLLLADSAGSNAGLYSKPYLAGLETQLPFRFNALNKQRQKLNRQRLTLMKLLETSALAPDTLSFNLQLKPQTVA